MLVATPGFQVLHQVFPALASAESAEPAVPRGDGLPCHGVNGCPIQTTLHLGLTTSFHHCQKFSIEKGPSKSDITHFLRFLTTPSPLSLILLNT